MRALALTHDEANAATIAAHAELIRELPCLICVRFGFSGTLPVELHHVAVGTSKRDEFAQVPLCTEHHRGGSGLHGMGARAFCLTYKVPFLSEYGLLAWLIHDLSARMRAAHVMIEQDISA